MDNYFIQRLEREIIESFNGINRSAVAYPHEKSLLRLRKDVLNYRVWQDQDVYLPAIIEFNEALTDALKGMYKQTLKIWENLKTSNEDGSLYSLKARCFFDYHYPDLHPIQNETRHELWKALCDTGWNTGYEDGVTPPLWFDGNEIESWESFMNLDVEPNNRSDCLHKMLTDDLHLIYPFHHLFDHTVFALTDFIYVRKFNTEINVKVWNLTNH